MIKPFVEVLNLYLKEGNREMSRARGIILILSLLTPGHALADRPKSYPVEGFYGTLESAILAAYQRVREVCNPRVECAGGVLKYDIPFVEVYGFSEPVAYSEKLVRDIVIEHDTTTKVIAIFHTHTDIPTEREYAALFSESDINASKEWEVAVFLGTYHDRSILMYDPFSDMRDFHMHRREPVVNELTSRGVPVCSLCW